MKKVSIIIPYHSNRNLLDACLHSLLQSTQKDTEIILVANNSNEKELEIDLPYPQCRIIKANQELFYPKAINLGAKHAGGEILIFCDADIVCTDKCVQNLLKHYHDPGIGFYSAKLLDPADGSIIDFGIGFTAYNSPHPFKGRPANFPLTEKNRHVQGACSAFSMISKKLFEDIGGFDERLVHSYSDIDLCLRLREEGWKTLCVHDAIAFHKGNSTLGSGMSDSLKGDTKGQYMALNAHRIHIDMDQYYAMAIQDLLSQGYTFSPAYYLIDMTTIADKQWHYDVLANLLHTQWSDLYNCPFQKRDSRYISLYECFDSNVRNIRFPILFFVDDFRSLQKNTIWKSLRNCSLDLVVDRNANVIPFDALEKEK